MRFKLQVLALFGVVFLLSQVGCSQEKPVEKAESSSEPTENYQPPIAPGDGFNPRGSQDATPTGSNVRGIRPPKIVYVPDGDGKFRAVAEMSYSQEATAIDGSPRSLNDGEINLSIGVLSFAVLVLLMLWHLRLKKAITGDVFFKSFGLIIVVGSSLFLISAGWSQMQITPIVGLLGTVVGFVFGKSVTPARRRSSGKSSTRAGKGTAAVKPDRPEKKDAESP